MILILILLAKLSGLKMAVLQYATSLLYKTAIRTTQLVAHDRLQTGPLSSTAPLRPEVGRGDRRASFPREAELTGPGCAVIHRRLIRNARPRH